MTAYVDIYYLYNQPGTKTDSACSSGAHCLRLGSERFKHTTRPYKVEDVVKLQGGGENWWVRRFYRGFRMGFGGFGIGGVFVLLVFDMLVDGK